MLVSDQSRIFGRIYLKFSENNLQVIIKRLNYEFGSYDLKKIRI